MKGVDFTDYFCFAKMGCGMGMYKYSELTSMIIGGAMKLHRVIGPGDRKSVV